MSSAVYPSPSKPTSVAKQLMEEHFTRDGTMTLRWWRSDFYEWTGTQWRKLDPGGLRHRIYSILDPVTYATADGESREWSPARGKVTNVLDALESVCYLSADVEPHSWIAGEDHLPAGEYVGCSNGLVHISTRELTPPTPALFNLVAAPFDYDPQAVCLQWDAFMESIWPEDPEAVQALQEWMGYVLSGRTDLQKILLLVGPPRAGKGVIGRILSALVGQGNVSGPSLASLGTDFGMAPLVGTSLALVSDARMRSDSQVVVERLLTISGEDTVTVNRKYREPWVGKIPARLMLMTNELPRLGDASRAISRRFLVVSLERCFIGIEDPGLEGRLRGELAGIFNWSLNGLGRLSQRGAFVTPLSSMDDEDLIRDLSSPVSVFLEEETVDAPGDKVGTDDVYKRWELWRFRNGHSGTSKASMSRDLRAARADLKIVAQYDPEKGGTRRFYTGIRLAAGSAASVGKV